MTESLQKTGKRKAHASAMRRAILSAAAAILAKEGINALSARRLASATNMSTKVIYSHFGGMPGVTSALYAHGFEMLLVQLETGAGADANLEAIALAYRGFALKNCDLFDIMYGPPVASLLPTNESRAAARPSLDLLVRAFIQRGSTNPEDKARQFWASLHGITALERGQWFDADETLARLKTLCRHYENGQYPESTLHPK